MLQGHSSTTLLVTEAIVWYAWLVMVLLLRVEISDQSCLNNPQSGHFVRGEKLHFFPVLLACTSDQRM